MDKQVIIEEQGLRDGIQNLATPIDTETKLSIINKLIDAGVKRIQVASFVHPRLVQQMADAEEICNQLDYTKDVLYSGLVLNVRGVQRGIAAGLPHLSCSMSASETHSVKNARKTLAEAKTAFKEMVGLCAASGVKVRGGIQCAFGCRYEGAVQMKHVMELVNHHLDLGVNELALADSTGMANPLQMEELMGRVIEAAENVPVLLHLHNTENKGYANLYAALRTGVRHFDTAFGGLGGCPFIKSASGNVATEDVVHMLQQMGYTTGIDVKKIAAIAQDMENTLQRKLDGRMYTLFTEPNIKIT